MSLSPETTLVYVKRRLRDEYIPSQAMDDDALLRYVTEGYQQLCQQAGVFETITTISDVTDQAEYALPADHFKTLRVYRDGRRQGRITDQAALTALQTGYYEYGDVLGVSPAPASTEGATTLLYVRTPAAPASWNSTLDTEFPPELAYGIVHYVYSRVATSIGGEARIQQAGWHRQQFEKAVTTLRRRSQSVFRTGSVSTPSVPYLSTMQNAR